MTHSAFILNLSLSELTKQLHEGSLSPEEVFYAYMDKTLDLQQKLNCCTEIILDSFEKLKTIDSGKKGLLYGVPVSVKENLSLKNCDSNCGVVKFIDQPADDDCVLVKVLKKQGAIPFVRTNFPQSLISFDCSNPFYGQTVNPYNLQKTSGGSSGGEASLIGGGGSVIGVGSDIGGSIRVPASFCGICGLKPTSGRLSSVGLKTFIRGQKAVESTIGPMAKDVDSLALFMKAVLCDYMFSLDPTVPPLPFNEKVYQSRKPLRIGYFEQIEETLAFPSMIRAVQEVKVLLEQAGHTLVPYNLVKKEMFELVTKGILPDGGRICAEQMKGTTVDPSLKFANLLWRTPNWLKKVIAFIIKPLLPFTSRTLQAVSGVGSIAGLFKLQASIEDCVKDTIAEWQLLNIDVVLCPILGPALNFHYCSKVYSMVPFSATFNLLNFCAGVVPVSTVTAQDEKNLCHFASGNMYERFLNKAAKGGEGLPVGVQCVALPWHEELCLRFMKEVEELVKKQKT
ncbi:fatty-acid amide hydrolase 1 isoform X2 [Boleophthalmus pectinirostris]|nr:fatty-acid amide hydrolase 1 isoform X2 [Boleophthalmus pectinirostris]XP_055021013.1 fatty-acid amide hydrolase 1 isoform X2 [Boleophthalmus pectinirostris]XP_055021014.1 fatty-acid amide hydrolase 1 isoform X2 [Boleophthalmus pectinirostris]